MAYVTPPTFAATDVLAAADLNVLGDDIVYLKAISDGLTFSGVRVTRTAATSIADATWTPVSWTAEVHDVGGWYSSGTDIIVPTSEIPAGFSMISLHGIARATFVASAAGYRGLRVLVNGSAVITGTESGFATDSAHIIGTDYLFVQDADVITMELYQNSGGALDASSIQLTLVRFLPVS